MKHGIFIEEKEQEEIASCDLEKRMILIEQTEISFRTVEDPPKYEDVTEIIRT